MIGDTLRSTRPVSWRPLLFRAGWPITAGLCLILFALAQWRLYLDLQVPCAEQLCTNDFYLSRGDVARLASLGRTPAFYAAWQVGLYVIFFLVHFVLAALIYARRPNDRVARLAAFAMVIWSTAFPEIPRSLWDILPAAGVALQLGSLLGGMCFWLFFLTLPNGTFAPRWLRWFMLLLLARSGLETAVQVYPWLSGTALGAVQRQTQPLFFPAVALLAIGSQIYRYRRVSSPSERQKTRWICFGIIAGLGWSLVVGLYFLFINPASQNDVIGKMLFTALIYAGFLLIPLSVGAAILRARLWEIDSLISRTLVYAVLTVCVGALYVLVVEALGALFRAQGSLLISLLATGLAAVLFQPLRERVQRAVNRMLYGDRDDPYTVLAGLGRQLEAALAPDTVLPTVVQTVRETLRLPYAAILLDQDGACVTAAADGEPVAAMLTLPLSYQGETIGQFVLAPRDASEPFGPADRLLLEDLARQAGVAAHGVRLMRDLQRLTEDLQRSRQRLVAAREEERRRIRRDLHDGLGPTLAALPMQIDTVRALMRQDVDVADELLVELKQEMRAAVQDIRQLVYALRPPALDQLGLVPAMRELAAKIPPGDLDVTVETPANLPPLAAAVEVGIYRVVQEALTNVVKHARARRCAIRLTIDREAVVVVHDDGVGLPAEVRSGVGLQSLRERAEELGGTCSIAADPAGGTVVCARIPLDMSNQIRGAE